MKIHFNNALHPDKDKAPACMVGSDSQKGFDHYLMTLDLKKVTCSRCLKVLGLERRKGRGRNFDI